MFMTDGLSRWSISYVESYVLTEPTTAAKDPAKRKWFTDISTQKLCREKKVHAATGKDHAYKRPSPAHMSQAPRRKLG